MAGQDDFEAFVRGRWVALLRTAYLLTGDRHLAEDLLQESLAVAARHWDRVCRAGAPEAYVRRVLYTRSVDAWRWRRRQPLPTDRREAAATGADSSADSDRRVVLAAALARLTPRQRAVLVLRFYEDRTEQQTAELLGCSVNTVKSQTRHALGRLRVL